MPNLDIHSTHLVYGDNPPNNNPQKRYLDWSRHIVSVPVQNPDIREYELLPGEVKTLFSGSRTTSIDSTTTFDIVLNPIKPNVYRIQYVSGTQPDFRLPRVLNLIGQQLTFAINNNATMVVSLPLASTSSFIPIQVGDIVFIPGVSTGDSSSPFNPNNCGFWVVLSRTNLKLTLARSVGEPFVGASETVTVTSANQFQAFSSSGVQVGDTLEISFGFSTITQRSFVVSQVTPVWIEFFSAEPLPLETSIQPNTSGMTFYNESKRFVRLEVNQESVVRLNNDTSNSVRIAPRLPGDPEGFGYFEKWGPCWALVVVNRSLVNNMTVQLITIE